MIRGLDYLATRPDVDPALQNHCVEGRMEWLEDGEPVPTTVLIPTTPVMADSARMSTSPQTRAIAATIVVGALAEVDAAVHAVGEEVLVEGAAGGVRNSRSLVSLRYTSILPERRFILKPQSRPTFISRVVSHLRSGTSVATMERPFWNTWLFSVVPMPEKR